MPQGQSRRYDLDWMRVLAILTVFVFHSGRFFDTMDWHVKNPVRYQAVQMWTMFLVTWMMPLIFVISGASLYFSLGKPGKFIKDKVLRLLVPLVVGVFSHVALGVYLERLTHYQFSGSFLEFIPWYFQGFYAFGGNFAWMGLHLWYLLMLFIFSLVFLPVFLLLKGRAMKFGEGLGRILAFPGMLYLPALLVAWIIAAVDPRSFFGQHGWGGWSIVSYIPFFLFGFLLFSQEKLQRSAIRWRWISLLLAAVCSGCLGYAYNRFGDSAFGLPGYSMVNGLYGASAWLWILAFSGLGMRYLNYRTPFLDRANEAVLPFYILHQTVLLCVGYFVVRWAIPDPAKFLIIGGGSFLIIVALYEILIRRINILRFLFGMKLLTRASPADSRVANTGPLKSRTTAAAD